MSAFLASGLLISYETNSKGPTGAELFLCNKAPAFLPHCKYGRRSGKQNLADGAGAQAQRGASVGLIVLAASLGAAPPV